MAAHLHVHGPFSHLDGASSAADLAARAATLGHTALALTDHNSLSGAVVFQEACLAVGIRPIVGAELTVESALGTPSHITLLAPDQAGYRHLSQLISTAHLSRPRGQPMASQEALAAHAPYLIGLSGCRRGEVAHHLLLGHGEQAVEAARRLSGLFGKGRFFLEQEVCRLPGDRPLQRATRDLGQHLGISRVATSNAHYAVARDFWLHDLLVCIRTRCQVDDLGPERPMNDWQFLQSAEEMLCGLPDDPGAVAVTDQVAELCQPALPDARALFPAFALPPGLTSAEAYLRQLTERGAIWRYGQISSGLRQRIEEELAVIAQTNFTDYMLVVAEIAGWARKTGIRTSGRGSAADSVVAYCLGLTDVDAFARNLPFARFLSMGRTDPPDVDLDFDASRREEVAAHVAARYGPDHVAAVATYVRLEGRSAIREIGQALGLPRAELGAIARRVPYYVGADNLRQALVRVPELAQLQLEPGRMATLFAAAERLADWPRHLGTHLGGLVLTTGPVAEVMPLQMAAKGAVVGQFDKRDCEALGLIKIDLLHLRTLSAVDEAVTLSGVPWENIPSDDPATFHRLRQAETVGAFQLESPAQRALHRRMQGDRLEDVIAATALIRPGPIKGDMVAPFVRRRLGKEPVTYPAAGLEDVLQRTYGVVVYQEQVLEIAVRVAGFSPAEADQLRRTMSRARSKAQMQALGEVFCSRAVQRGVDGEAAGEIWQTLLGYASYGFAEGHAAAFGLIGYRTLYLLEHHSAVWYAALLNHQPMGYYPPQTLVTEARRRGIGVRGPDVNQSAMRWTVEDGALCCGLLQVRGLDQAEAERVLANRPYRTVRELAERTQLSRAALQQLAMAGALDGISSNRRNALWQIEGQAALRDLPDFTAARRLALEMAALGLAVSAHPLSFFRPSLERAGVLRTDQALCAPHRMQVAVAGALVRPHRPPTRSGERVVFLCLEDESGLLDVTVSEAVYRQSADAIFGPDAWLLAIEGTMREVGTGANLDAQRVTPLRTYLKQVGPAKLPLLR